jgi:type IV pilus assembly protein PilN
MIHINLLPVRAAKKREFGRQQLVLFVLLLVLAGIGNYFVYNRFESELRSLDKQIATTRAEIAQLEKTIGEVKSIKDDKKALEDKLKILDTLKKGRTGPVKVLDELASVVPQKVWILEFSEQNGGVSITGQAVNYEDLSTFSKKLKASTHFTNITIKGARQRPDGTVDWVITCNANYSA